MGSSGFVSACISDMLVLSLMFVYNCLPNFLVEISHEILFKCTCAWASINFVAWDSLPFSENRKHDLHVLYCIEHFGSRRSVYHTTLRGPIP